MRIVTLNARHGGGTRTRAIADYLDSQNADLVVLTEYRAGPAGNLMRDALRSVGYQIQAASVTEPKINGVMIASRDPVDVTRLPVEGETARRIVACRTNGVAIFGVYFANGKAKLPLYSFIAAQSREWTAGPALLIGDFNTGRHHMDEKGATFVLVDHFENLEMEHGWVDAWRQQHGPSAREYSWFSPRWNNGFRLDHVFASPGALPLIERSVYDHSTRPAITDHSAMIVDLHH